MVDLSKRRLFQPRARVTPISSSALPWLKDPASFTDQCTRCGECIPACETKIIVISDGGFPHVEFNLDECTFCYQCADACPEPLFLNREHPAWQDKAIIDAKCLAKNRVDCRCCNESCEQAAISFHHAVGGPATPSISTQLCNGCGACVATCPSQSITISIPADVKGQSEI
ncbi:ferredoxin-type protein NapF [Vibrio sp. RC27]